MKLFNRKEYPDNGIFIEEKTIYSNLHVYPLVAKLEKHAGLINEIVESFYEEGIDINTIIYGNSELEDYQFLKDNNCNSKGTCVLAYIFENYDTPVEIFKSKIIISKKNDLFNYFDYKILFDDYFIYTNEKNYNIFMKHFWYYFNDSNFNYDNLVCLTMIVKNAGPLLEKVLLDNIDHFDRWCILDTGSTDGTQDLVKRVLINKKGKLFEEPFVNFKISRNRCLELAGYTCKFILMLDDTYSLQGNLRSFLNEIRGDQFSDSFSLLIQSEDSEYYSNRIIKSKTNLRYKYTVHEVITEIDNINVTIPKENAWIFDNRSEYMERRTMDRKKYDLQLLFEELKSNPNDPRSLYYIAQTYGCIEDWVNQAKYF